MRKTPKLVDSLFPKTRQAIIASLVLQPEKWWYISDLAKHIGTSPSSLQRELAALNASGILERRVDGKRVYFRPDKNCPILSELQGIFLKTSGLVDVLEKALKGFSKEIEFAFVFGSIARGQELSESDVDLMIVGALKLAELAPKLRAVEKKLMREVNPVIYSLKEFRKRVGEKDHFLTTVIKEKKLFLKGKDDYLEGITFK